MAVDTVRAGIWTLYTQLKGYQEALSAPSPEWAKALAKEFDELFSPRTRYATLDRLLKRLRSHKSELLLVLKRPDVPLHTNGSESDLRE